VVAALANELLHSEPAAWLSQELQAWAELLMALQPMDLSLAASAALEAALLVEPQAAQLAVQ
jgi:hypothetical protein